MKKVLCIFLSILMLMGCMGCAAAISYPAGTAVRICYDRENVSFDLELSQEEASVVLSVLNGKRRDLDMTVTGAACGFGREQSFIIDGSTYCLAQDGCGVIWEEGTENYYVISQQEFQQLKEIFKAHGAKIIWFFTLCATHNDKSQAAFAAWLLLCFMVPKPVGIFYSVLWMEFSEEKPSGKRRRSFSILRLHTSSRDTSSA